MAAGRRSSIASRTASLAVFGQADVGEEQADVVENWSSQETLCQHAGHWLLANGQTTAPTILRTAPIASSPSEYTIGSGLDEKGQV